jgi:hypothetical protein
VLHVRQRVPEHATAAEPGQGQGIEQRQLLSLSLKRQEPKGHGASLSIDTECHVPPSAGSAACGETTLHHVVQHVSTHAQYSGGRENQTENYFLLQGGYSGAPLVFGKLMVVVGEPLDIGDCSPPLSV